MISRDLPDPAATARLGAAIAKVCRAGDVVALLGGLGAGKTTLARSIIAALGHAGEVPSPSFAIIEIYEPPAVRLPVVHADFYRLGSAAETGELGLDEYRDGALLIAEWPEHAGGFAHEAGCLAIEITAPEGANANVRLALITAGAGWQDRLAGLDAVL